MVMPDSGDSGAMGLLKVCRGLIPAGLVEEAIDALGALMTAAGAPGSGDLDARIHALTASGAGGWRHRRADGFDLFKAEHPELVELEETP